MSERTILLTAAITASLMAPAFAADSVAPSQSTKEVIVTATRTEEEVKNVPNSVEVITADDIQKLGAANVYDALKLADNVNIIPQNNGFGRRISIRGGATNEGLILVNGHRIAVEDTSTSQNLMTLDRINVNNIERIEIVRGAASAQYGSDALSGVINIITKTSGKDESLTAGVTTGTESINNYYHVETGDIGKFSGSVDVSIGKDRNRMMQNGMGYLYGPKHSVDLNGTYRFNDHQSLRLDASYFKADQEADWPGFESSTVRPAITGMVMGMIYGSKDKPGMKPSMNRGEAIALANKALDKYLTYDPNKAKLDQEQKNISLTFDGKSDKNNYTLRTYYSRLEKSRLLPYEIMGAAAGEIAKDLMNVTMPFIPVPAGEVPTYGETNKYTVWGVEGKDSMAIGDNHLLTFGGEYTSNTVEGNNVAGASKDTQTYAGYVQDEWMVGDKLLLIPAVRYDHHSDFGSKTTPKIGATYFLNNNSRFKVNWGKGFKAPTVTELYSDFYHAGNTIWGNPDLVPEESTNFDVSYELEGHGNFGKVTYFNNHVENYITTHNIPDGTGSSLEDSTWSQYYNLDGTTKLHGVELEVGRNFNRNWTAKINSNWTSASNNVTSSGNSGHGVDGIAKNMTTAQVIYDDLKPYGFTFNLWDQLAYDYSDGNNEYTYNTLNFVVTKKFGEGKRVFVGLDNILDKKIGAINLDGRMWRVGAEVKF
ncbi:TonB-dependent siderophore receptor [uncultured Megasphaera sp.]|uniref:TonB-dependent receptor plug domain-containing protein n=1 Tax=uncultured Megasphaera sp. TaxID=165188 RepID=UPI002657E412|nr:TonB-dependent receptor [uncultured Megasphaera sp.]